MTALFWRGKREDWFDTNGRGRQQNSEFAKS